MVASVQCRNIRSNAGAQNCSVHYLLLSSLLSSLLSFLLSWPSRPKQQIYNSTSYRPGGGETICPPPMAVRLATDLYARPRTGPRPHMVKLQAASVPIAYGSCAPRAAAPWDRQTDGSRYRLMPPYGRGIIKPYFPLGRQQSTAIGVSILETCNVYRVVTNV